MGLKAKLIASLPKATVADCKADLGTPADRQQRGADAKLQREEATAAGNQGGSRWHGRRP